MGDNVRRRSINDSALNRIDRISALLVQLQSRPIVKASEIADRFEVSLRTIYRDMRTLSETGVPICGNSGVGITYSYPRWYISAWCHLREEYRIFRLDRIGNIKTTSNKYTKVHPPLESLLGCDDPQSLIEVVLHTSKEVSKRFADRCHFMGLTAEKELADGQVEQTYMAYSLEGLTRWVLANADTTTVIHPVEIKDIIKQIINKLDL